MESSQSKTCQQQNGCGQQSGDTTGASFPTNIIITGGTFIQQVGQQNTSNGFNLLQRAATPAAFHDSSARFNPPRCHPNTRVAVIQKMMDWLQNFDETSRGKFIMWLRGAAGAGKSAIAQSLAERLYSEGRLLAAFFFSRMDPDRCHARKLVATIAYQIYHTITTVQGPMVLAIDRDPLIFTRTLFAQFEALIIRPLGSLETGFLHPPSLSRLIVIDGLDECVDCVEREEIITTISQIILLSQLPIKFLITSRPEHDICATFMYDGVDAVSELLDLDNIYFSRDDIELYFHTEFDRIRRTHPFRHLIPTKWPSDKNVKALTLKSSGQFIYASTVVKYVQSIRHLPHQRLEVVQNIRPLRSLEEHPFAMLDAIYAHILSNSAPENVYTILRVLCFVIRSNLSRDMMAVEHVETILGLNSGDIDIIFCDLGSLVSIHENELSGKKEITILHATLQDYLFDPSRSRSFYISSDYVLDGVLSSMRFLSGTLSSRDDSRQYITDEDEHPTLWFLAKNYFARNSRQSILTSTLFDELKSFSITRIYESAPQTNMFDGFHNGFLPKLFDLLKHSTHEESRVLYEHHTRIFRESFIARMIDLDVHHSRTAANANLALHFALCCHCEYDSSSLLRCSDKRTRNLIPPAALLREFRLFEWEWPTDDSNSDGYYPVRSGWIYQPLACQTPFECEGYLKILKLLSPLGRADGTVLDDMTSLAESWRVFGNEVYAAAAVSILEYLCDSSLPRRRMKDSFIAMRRDFPQKWRSKFGRHGSCKRCTDLRLVRKLDDRTFWHSFDNHLTLRNKSSRPIYLFANLARGMFDMHDPIVVRQVRVEKYLLALECLVLFFPMAGKSEKLIDLCQTKAFSLGSCDHPKRSKEARRAIDHYLSRTADGLTLV